MWTEQVQYTVDVLADDEDEAIIKAHNKASRFNEHIESLGFDDYDYIEKRDE